MNKRSSRTGFAIAIGVVLVLATAGAMLFLRNNRQASVIPPMSSMEDAKNLSNGKRQACLADNEQAVAAVKADDKYLDEAEEFSNFEMTASGGIMDVPAGTYYDTTINSYSDDLVVGSITYEKDYGKYNYNIKKLSGDGEWEFVSMIACE